MPDYVTDGDQGFIGVNSRLDPSQLQPGIVAEAKNKRFVSGVAKTRPGSVLLPWSNKAEADYEDKVYAENSIVRYSGRKRRISGGTNSDHGVADGVVNGTFAADSDWTKGTGWTIPGNGFAEVSSESAQSNLYQDVGAASGHEYLVTFTLSALNNSTSLAGNIKVFVGHDQTDRPTFTAAGTHSCVVTSVGSNEARLLFQKSSDFVGKISNVTFSEPTQVQLSDNQGVLSNPSKGPYFQRNSTNAGSKLTPLNSSGNVNSGWTDLGSRTYPFGTVYGIGVYSDPNSVEYLLVATSTGVYFSREGNLATKLAGKTPDGPVEMVQAFSRVIMFRGEDKRPYILKDLASGFEEITQEDNEEDLEENDQGDGTEAIPSAATGIYFQNRLFIPHSRDLISASDYLSVSRYQPVLSSFRINQGSADKLVALHKFDNSSIVCFKEASIYIVRNVYGNLMDIVLDEITSGYGCASEKSVTSVGRDVWFLSEKRGVCSLGITDSGAVQGIDQPLSEPIQPLVDRINWNHKEKAAAIFFNNRYYLACALDNALDPDGNASNTAVLVYDFLNQSWAGYDDKVYVQDWIEITVSGKKRLCYLGYDGTINLYDDDEYGGLEDEVVSAAGVVSTNPILDSLTTRGYNLKTPDRKRWHSARISLNSLNVNMTTSATVDGVEEKTAIQTISTINTKYDKPFYKADFVATNVNDDFFDPYRQDYSVTLANDSDTFWLSKVSAGVCNLSQYTNQTDCENNGGQWGYVDTQGFNPSLEQESVHKLRLNESGRYVQIVTEGTQGSNGLTSIVVDGLPKNTVLKKEV